MRETFDLVCFLIGKRAKRVDGPVGDRFHFNGNTLAIVKCHGVKLSSANSDIACEDRKALPF